MNYYEILEISRNASEEVIKNAYRALVKKYHPDKNGNSIITDERMRKINEAYEVLSDKEKRAIYDNELLFKEQEEKRLEEERLYHDIIDNNTHNIKEEYVDKNKEKKSLKERFEALSEKQKKKVICIIAVISFFVVFLFTFIISSLCTPSTKKENEEKKDEFVEDDTNYDINENYVNKGNDYDYDVKNFHDEEVIEKETEKTTDESKEKDTKDSQNNVDKNKDSEKDTKKDNIVTIY